MAETDVEAVPTTGTKKSAVAAARAKALEPVPEPVSEQTQPAVAAPKVPRARTTTSPTLTIPGLYLG